MATRHLRASSQYKTGETDGMLDIMPEDLRFSGMMLDVSARFTRFALETAREDRTTIWDAS